MRRLEERLVEDVRRLRQQDPRGALLLVVPSRLLGAWLRARLARALDGVAGIHVVTLPELAERVALAAARARGTAAAPGGGRPAPRRPGDPRGGAAGGRLLLRGARRAELPGGRAADPPRRQARRARARGARGGVSREREGPGARGVLPALETAIARHGYYDASDLLAEAARLVVADPGRLDAAAVLAFGFVEMNPLEARLLDACGRAAPVLRYVAGADAADLPAPAAIEIVAAPGEEREVREIARVILGHVEAGGRLDEVGILLRQPAAYLAAVRDVFGAAGIPYTLGTAPAVGETRAGRSLRLLAEVRRSDFARAAVMEFLAFADLRARPGTSPAEWERLSRQAGIVGGAREWRERLDRLGRRLAPVADAAADDDDEDGRARRAGDRDALGALRRAAQRPPARPLAASGSRARGGARGRLHADVPPPRGDVPGGRAGAGRARPAPGARRGGRRRPARGVLDAPRGGARRPVGRRGRSPDPAACSSASWASPSVSTSRSPSCPGWSRAGSRPRRARTPSCSTPSAAS